MSKVKFTNWLLNQQIQLDLFEALQTVGSYIHQDFLAYQEYNR